MEEGFGERLMETSGDEGISIIQACMIEEDNGCKAYRVGVVKEVSVSNTTRCIFKVLVCTYSENRQQHEIRNHLNYHKSECFPDRT